MNMCLVLQKMLLGIILTSLEDHSHVSSLLGYSYSAESEDRLGSQDLHLAEVLMKTLLRNLSFHTVGSSVVYWYGMFLLLMHYWSLCVGSLMSTVLRELH
jgi:hypothetical protein